MKIANTLKDAAKGGLRAIGLEVQKTRGASTEPAIIKNLLRSLSPVAVLDVGANIGQFAQGIRALGYGGLIISFEALPFVHAELVRNARKDANWVVADCAALGNADGEAQMNVSGNVVSSSLLPIDSRHVEAATDSSYVRTDKVRIRRLDEIGLALVPKAGGLMLKIDTQGYEKQVLQGASGLLERVSSIQVELSLVQLYSGAPTLSEMVPFIESLGFEMFNVAPGFKDQHTGRLLQLDGFFVRKKP